jgi:hypothetical protein
MRNKNKSDIERIIRAPITETGFNGFGLYIVVDATAIAGTNYRWLYKIKPAFMKGVLTTPDFGKAEIYADADPTGYDAVSISELGNDMNSPRIYSYGVTENNLTGSFLPVRIPNQTPVIAMPYRCNNGDFRYIIINTQAINGDCP